MKSLVALLDRKKKDRANTLVQVPFPSSLPQPAVHQDGTTFIHGTRRTSTPLSSLRPSQQPRAVSDTGHMHRPLLSEPSVHYPGQSPAQSASYYTDSDDGTCVDPFAHSPTKLDLTSKPQHEAPPQVYPRRGSEVNTASTFAPASYRFRPEREPLSVANEPRSDPVLAAPASKKGRWLRERRSLTSLLRPQQSKNPVEPVPIVPSLPSRVPERKPSLFFTRSRSGSTPLSAQTIELAHTVLKPSIGLESVQLPTPANAQPQAVDKKSKHGTSYRGSVPLTPMPHSQANSPDSWIRVEGASRDPVLPTSPTTRRRAISVPLPLQSTGLPPPVPSVQRTQCVQKPEANRSTTGSEPAVMRHPGTPTDFRTRRSHNTHGIKSASVSVPASARLNASPGFVTREQEQLVPHHNKQLSVGTVECLVLKSALKHRLVESIQNPPALPVHPVKPLRICKREGPLSKTEPAQLPTPSSEGSLKAFHYAPTGHKDGVRATTKHCKSASGPPSGEKCLDTMEGPVPPSTTAGSFSNIMKGHGLPSSDSRSLPVLDNIWGSFVSETAFGNSLPPSPITSISARYQATLSQETNSREQIGDDSMDLESGTNASCSSHSEGHWKPGSAPPSSPPLTTLPPVPNAPPALDLLLGKGTRRKRSRSSANAVVLLTPPTSPTEEVQPQGLDRVITSSTYGNNPTSRSSNKHSEYRQQLGPRLARSASSPSIRPSMSPEIGCNPIKMRGPDALSRLLVQHQKSRSISPSSSSHSSSQCTPVPGTPVALHLSAVNHATSHLGTSSGSLTASSPSVRMPRLHEGSGYAESSEGPVMGMGIRPSGTESGGVSDAIMGGFPPIPSNQVLPYQEEKSIGAMISHNTSEGDPREEPLLTPPVTPAWAIHVFDTETEDNSQLSRMEYNSSGDRIPLARSGNLAQMRRQKRGDMRSGLTQLPSRRPDLPQHNYEKTDACRNRAPKNATSLARNVV